MDDETLDLSSLDVKAGAEAGFELQLTHPQSGDLLPIWITVLGADADTYQHAVRRSNTRGLEMLSRRKRVTPEEHADQTLELLATITRGWRSGPKVTLKGQPFPAFSVAAAKQLYADFPWIREQVDQAMADRANFLPRRATS
jgi:hypothetical protein